MRKMVCRLGVKKHLKGIGPLYDREEKNLICVYDMQKFAYRSISIEGIHEIVIHGETKLVARKKEICE